MKNQMIDYLTFQEKIEVLNYYYLKNKTINVQKAWFAKKIAEIYETANKLNNALAIKFCDKVMRTCSKITRSRVIAPTKEEKIKEPRIMAKFAPQIDELNLSEKIIQKIAILRQNIELEVLKTTNNELEK